MTTESGSGADFPIYSPRELQRLAQFQQLIHKSNEFGQYIKDGATPRLITKQENGTETEILSINGRVIGAMKDMALNMYSEYFANNPKLKDAALDITAAEKELRGEAEGITEAKFTTIWEAGEDL